MFIDGVEFTLFLGGGASGPAAKATSSASTSVPQQARDALPYAGVLKNESSTNQSKSKVSYSG